MDTYQIEANEILENLGVTMDVAYSHNGPHFGTDDDRRDIYEITIYRGCNSFSLKFGQSIVGTQNGEIPASYDVFTGLVKYEPGTYEEFCGDYGYDEMMWDEDEEEQVTNPYAESIYKAVRDEWGKMSAMFTESELELLQEIV